MTGLLLILVLALWTWLALTLADRFTDAVARVALRRGLKFLLFLALLPLPLADEIYSRGAFTRMCETDTKLVLIDPQLAGKRIWFAGVRSVPRKIGLLQGREQTWTYVVAGSEAPAFHHSSFEVEGGWLMRMLGISQTSSPLLLPKQCDPVDAGDLPRRLNITVVDKPVP